MVAVAVVVVVAVRDGATSCVMPLTSLLGLME